MISFLEKTKFTLPSDTNIDYRYVLLPFYSIIFAGQFHLLRNDDRGVKPGPGPEDICHFNNDRTLTYPKTNQKYFEQGERAGVPVLHGSAFDYIYARIYNINSSLELVGFREGV